MSSYLKKNGEVLCDLVNSWCINQLRPSRRRGGTVAPSPPRRGLQRDRMTNSGS